LLAVAARKKYSQFVCHFAPAIVIAVARCTHMYPSALAASRPPPFTHDGGPSAWCCGCPCDYTLSSRTRRLDSSHSPKVYIPRLLRSCKSEALRCCALAARATALILHLRHLRCAIPRLRLDEGLRSDEQLSPEIEIVSLKATQQEWQARSLSMNLSISLEQCRYWLCVPSWDI
jgi:hypothetical protein